MKVLIASIVLFVLILGTVIGNAVYSDISLGKFSELAQKAYQNSTSDEVLNELFDYWESHKTYFGLTATLKDIDSVTENLLNLQTAITHGNTQLAEQSYVLLQNAIDDIRRFEKLSPANIF